MKTVNIKVKQISLEKLDLKANVMVISLDYEENNGLKTLKKNCSLNDEPLKIVETMFNMIRNKVKDEKAVMVDTDDFLAYYVNIIFNHGDKDKIVAALKRFKERIKTLRNVAMHGSYLKHYNELIGLKTIID